MFKLKSSNPDIQIAYLAAIALCCIAALTGCGNDDEEAKKSTGLVQISWSSSDCLGGDTLRMVAIVYDRSFGFITYGGPWACSSEQGLTSDVTSGPDRQLVLFAEDKQGAFKYRGEKRYIDVENNMVTDAGDVTLYPFVPQLSEPINGKSVRGEFFLKWGLVTGAARYRVLIADDANFSHPAVVEEVNGPPYSPGNIDAGSDYFWKVISLDIYGNFSAFSESGAFTIKAPEVKIFLPQNGTNFSTSKEILLAGEGIDDEEGALTEDQLIWYSDIDGEIGFGEISWISGLSAGTHVITLTATNSIGYVGNDSVTVHIEAE